MGKHKPVTSRFFVKLRMKEESAGKRGYRKIKTLIRPPLFLLNILDWKDGDKLGIYVSSGYSRSPTLNFFNVAKDPRSEYNVGFNAFLPDFDPDKEYKGKVAVGLAAARKMLPKTRKIQIRDYRKAEKYLNDNYPPEDKESGTYWVYDDLSPIQFREHNDSNIIKQIDHLVAMLDYQRSEHYTPNWLFRGGKLEKYKRRLKKWRNVRKNRSK